MKIVFDHATEEDAAQLAPLLRSADKAELSALSNRSYDVTLRLSVMMSDEPMTITADGAIVAMFGVARSSVMSSTGAPWLLGSDRVDGLVKSLLPQSRNVVDHWRTKYPHLVNYVSVDHHQSIRWLKWLGFEFQAAAPYGRLGNLFHKFEMRSGDV